MVILWQDCYVKGNFENILLKLRLGEGFHLGMPVRTPSKRGYSYLCMWMTSNWLERNKTLIRCGKYEAKKLIWENQHHSLIMKT